jgi:hypothetical protein
MGLDGKARRVASFGNNVLQERGI